MAGKFCDMVATSLKFSFFLLIFSLFRLHPQASIEFARVLHASEQRSVGLDLAHLIYSLTGHFKHG